MRRDTKRDGTTSEENRLDEIVPTPAHVSFFATGGCGVSGCGAAEEAGPDFRQWRLFLERNEAGEFVVTVQQSNGVAQHRFANVPALLWHVRRVLAEKGWESASDEARASDET